MSKQHDDIQLSETVGFRIYRDEFILAFRSFEFRFNPTTAVSLAKWMLYHAGKEDVFYKSIPIRFKLNIKECPTCGKGMMIPANYGLFPVYRSENQEQQMKKFGVVYKSEFTCDGETICVECANAGKANFTCYLCKERRSSESAQVHIGYDILCVQCYNTVTARKWVEITEELHEIHKYDNM